MNEIHGSSPRQHAFGIDPHGKNSDSKFCDYHYMMRFGAMMATLFCKDKGAPLPGQVPQPRVYGTSVTHPESFNHKFMFGLGRGKVLVT